MPPATLFALSGRVPSPADLTDATLVMIDYQNEYLAGPLALEGADEAIQHALKLLAAARECGARIIHVAHRGAPGGFFDRSNRRGDFIETLGPHSGETVVEKTLPNAFSGTDLSALVGPPGAAIVVAGFMTHNCVSSTIRAALDLSLAVTLAADACATRNLPAPDGGIVPAVELHRAELAALSDRHACVVNVVELIRLSAPAPSAPA
jgi:nicotinamidase-related amidase